MAKSLAGYVSLPLAMVLAVVLLAANAHAGASEEFDFAISGCDLVPNGIIERDDLRVISDCLSIDPSATPSCSASDVNGDGSVDGRDLSGCAGLLAEAAGMEG